MLKTLTLANLKEEKVSNLAYVVGSELICAAKNGAQSFSFKELCALCTNNSTRNLRRAFAELLQAGFLAKNEQTREKNGRFGETAYFTAANEANLAELQNAEFAEFSACEPCAKQRKRKEAKEKEISQIRALTHTRKSAKAQKSLKKSATPVYFAEILDDLSAMKRRITLFLPNLEFDFDAKCVEAGFNEAQKTAIERFVAYRENLRTTGNRLTSETLANIISQGVRAIKRGDDLAALVETAIAKKWQAFYFEKSKFGGVKKSNSVLTNPLPHRAPWQQRGWQNKSEFEKQAEREREAQIDSLLRAKVKFVRDANGNAPTTPEARAKAFEWLKRDFYSRGGSIVELL